VTTCFAPDHTPEVGRGKDETAWAVMKVLNGILYLLKVGHEVADPTKAMAEIAQDARRFNIRMIEVEPNFGQGMRIDGVRVPTWSSQHGWSGALTEHCRCHPPHDLLTCLSPVKQVDGHSQPTTNDRPKLEISRG
jgi:hypothetical protein